MGAFVTYPGDKGCAVPMLPVQYNRAHRVGLSLARAVSLPVARKEFLRSGLDTGRQTDG